MRQQSRYLSSTLDIFSVNQHLDYTATDADLVESPHAFTAKTSRNGYIRSRSHVSSLYLHLRQID